MTNVFHRPRLCLPLVVVLLFALAGCKGGSLPGLTYRPQAIGKEGVIHIVTDSVTFAGPIGQALREELGPWVSTLPAPEPMFELKRISLVSQRMVDFAQKQKNVVFVAPLDDQTVEAEFLRSRFDAEALQAVMGGTPVALARPDQWRLNQLAYYITGANEDEVVRAIQEAGKKMRYAYNLITRQRTQSDMFDNGRQFELETHLMERHQFAVNVQHDFQIAMDTTGFVWLRRILSDSWRSVFIYYEENGNPGDLSPEWIYATRDAITKQYIQGNVAGYVAIDYPPRRPLETENINFLERFGYETRGLWHMIDEGPGGKMIEMGGGGPFVTYAFYDQESGRNYLIDGMVFAPGYDKREFLRHMEVIAYTFRSQADVERQQAQQATD